MTLFCFGLGYAAGFLARAWAAQGGTVHGTHRAAETDESFGFAADRPLSDRGLAALQDASAVLISIPPDADGDVVFRHYGALLEQSPRLRWLGLLSSTGVYGDRQGEWVTETTPAQPGDARASQRVLAERQWLAADVPAHIFRLSGIYGPGRSALDRARDGAVPVHKAGHLFNRIHVADIAAALSASIAKPTPGEIYNLSDDLPAPGDEVLRYAYELLGTEPPPAIAYEAADLSPMAQGFYAECKRVRAIKIKDALALQWRYPDYRSGLRQLQAREGHDEQE